MKPFQQSAPKSVRKSIGKSGRHRVNSLSGTPAALFQDDSKGYGHFGRNIFPDPTPSNETKTRGWGREIYSDQNQTDSSPE